MRIIVINNQKGGSGKTTTAINLGSALASRGKKTLLIDLDPQASASLWMGVAPKSKDLNLFDLNESSDSIIKLAVPTSVDDLDIIPFSPMRDKNSKEMKQHQGRGVLLKKKLENLPKGSWDYVLLDCAPGLNLITLNALTAAREIIIPVVANSLSLFGVVNVVKTMSEIKKTLNPDFSISGILLCRINETAQHTLEIQDLITEKFGKLVFKTCIHEDIKLAECPSFRNSILEYDSNSQGAKDFKALAREIIAQEKS